jgi:hypothetical protein
VTTFNFTGLPNYTPPSSGNVLFDFTAEETFGKVGTVFTVGLSNIHSYYPIGSIGTVTAEGFGFVRRIAPMVEYPSLLIHKFLYTVIGSMSPKLPNVVRSTLYPVYHPEQSSVLLERRQAYEDMAPPIESSPVALSAVTQMVNARVDYSQPKDELLEPAFGLEMDILYESTFDGTYTHPKEEIVQAAFGLEIDMLYDVTVPIDYTHPASDDEKVQPEFGLEISITWSTQ